MLTYEQMLDISLKINRKELFLEDSVYQKLNAIKKQLNMNIVGISFHIGSGAMNPNAFIDALSKARKLYNLGNTYGYDMNIIDIGGGFSVNNISKMSKAINTALENFFPENDKFKFIAEPGRYFAENVATFLTKIIGVRERNGMRDYYLNESTYGSFNCIVYDHTKLKKPSFITSESTDLEKISTIYGNTCDGGDIIATNILLPKLNVDDWLVWDNFGAYTIAGACDFNGIELTSPNNIYVY